MLTQKDWYKKLFICKDVVGRIEKIFTQFRVCFMPVNGAYYCHTGYLEKIPPSQLFEIEYFIQQNEYERVVDIIDDLENYEIIFFSHEKTVFVVLSGKSRIRVTFFYMVRTLQGKIFSAEKIFSRGVKSDNPFLILPSNEDVLFLLVNDIFRNIGICIDSALFFKLNLLISQQNFSFIKFWSMVSEYGMERFATYILLLYIEQEKIVICLPHKYFYSSLLSLKILQKLYPLFPRTLKVIFFKIPFIDNPISHFFIKYIQNIRKKCMHTSSDWYTCIIKKLAKQAIIQNENTVYQNVCNSILVNAKEYTLSESNNERLFISTSTGLWVMNENRIQQLTAGISYGITRIGNRWYLHQYICEYSRIISFRIDFASEKSKMRDIRIEFSGLPQFIHQIDSFNNHLYITDTLKNRILCINENKKRTFIYPNKKIRGNIPKRMNNHFNSIYITDSFIYVLAHNGRSNPKQNSQIFMVSRLTHKIMDILEIDAKEAHNIVLYKKKLMYNDSLGCALKWGSTRLFTDKKHYLRGLAITKDTIFVGGSQIIKSGTRLSSDSVLWFLDHMGGVKRSIELVKIGQICEIRSIDFDYGLSES